MGMRAARLLTGVMCLPKRLTKDLQRDEQLKKLTAGLSMAFV